MKITIYILNRTNEKILCVDRNNSGCVCEWETGKAVVQCVWVSGWVSEWVSEWVTGETEREREGGGGV